MDDKVLSAKLREIENSLLRFSQDTNLQECCQSLLDCLGIKYTIIDPSTQPASFFFSRTNLENKDEYLEKITNMSVVGVATQDTFLSEASKTITSDELEKQLEDDHYKEMVFISFDTTEPFTRSEIALATRAINRKMYSKPVVLFIRHANHLSISTCERTGYIRAPKTTRGEKVGTVTILRDIFCPHPHHGHVAILSSLDASKCEPSFDALYAHWLETFNNELLTKKFYEELSDWYAWAIKNVSFPNELDNPKKNEIYNNENVIRLVTRLIFVWFLKEKHLIPEELFNVQFLSTKLLKDFSPNTKEGLFGHMAKDSHYYKAILQNLFFATLNCPIIDPDTNETNNRHFAGNSSDDSNNKVMKHKDYFINPDLFVELVNKTVPFLNGGLFDCLDDSPRIFYDGFSDKEDISSHLIVPDDLFFGDKITIDLSDYYGDKNKKKVTTRGLIKILKNYNFTIEENTPYEQEVSLDPELLGKVFENLLASYNPETKTTARKQTGSFYTPRDIVQYMVDESIVEHLKRTIDPKLEPLFRNLVSYSKDEVDITDDQRMEIMKSLYECKVLDPACGSGAFPVGILQQMVHIISRIDPTNERWKDLMIDVATAKSRAAFRTESQEERDERLKDIYSTFDEHLNYPDYARKLFLIENCIYGVDIQPIAIQISHLRFFISLIVDQKENSDPASNFGIRPLPNLESKFVAANSLVPLKKNRDLFSTLPQIMELEDKLHEANHQIFKARTPQKKAAWKKKLNDYRLKLADLMVEEGFVSESAGNQISSWDMFNQNAFASFFDSEWMFGINKGFDIVIGNPPFVVTKKGTYKGYDWDTDLYKMFFEASLKRFLKDDGVLSFITPKFYLLNKDDQGLRDYMLDETDLALLALCNPFDAVTENVITITKKSVPSSDQIHNYKRADDTGDFEELPKVLKSVCKDNGYHEIVLGNDCAIQKILERFNKNAVLLKTICTSKRGAEVGKKAAKSLNSGIKTLIGEDCWKYTTCWADSYLSDEDKEYKRLKSFFSPDLILLRRVEKCLSATIVDNETYAFTKNLYGIRIDESKGYSSKFILGWLNSSPVNFYYRKKFSTKKENAFPEIQAYLYEQLPVPDISKEKQLAVESLVNQALEERKRDCFADISSLEDEINVLVFTFYGFEYDDVIAIDPTFPMSKDEYDKKLQD